MIVKGSKINDRYQIIKTLGEGGMANVYLAHDTILDRNVAVKVLRGDLANDEKFVRRFQREALSASSLSHPNIVEMYDVGEDDGQYYIVMEYVDGKTLKQVLKSRGHLSITEVVDIMLQLTDGLAHAHDAYIIHRDIKPQNIMILSNGMIKITDFGVATALNSTQLTQTNSVMGTVHYLPPEQAQGKGSTIRSDIYSMGIMMYELLTGLVPYKGDNAVEIALKHLKEPLPSVRKANPSIPQSIENIIIKATAKNPKNRYTDARAMHDDLKTALDESRKDEKRYVYKYPENDSENTKDLSNELASLKKTEESKKKVEEAPKKVVKKASVAKLEEVDEDDERGGRKRTLIVFLGIFTALILVTTIVATMFFEKEGKVENKIIPDVSGKNIVDATNELVDAGFDVSTEYKYVASDTVEEELVVKTSPEIGTKRKTGSTIILYVSSGEGTYIVEDFTGQNYLEAKGKIEAQCECNVMVEQVKVSEKDKKKEDTVIKTEPAAGESSKLGSQITIYIPKVEYKYPDFTKGYTIAKIEKYCKEKELKLEYRYQTSSTVPAGTILKQSRAAGSVVTPGATLIITISTEPEKEESMEEDPDISQTDTTGE
ncbi:MAG: Stk1 family PASTA domain-containing Ser/Thr kinase [Bacilli bacterium]|nr:Stk1 family PASTA domain-containing Ser/Thr kinase [Bacilli bacterium]